MTMNTTYTLSNASLLIPQVANKYNWAEMYRNSTFYTLLNQLGMIDAFKGDFKVEINKTTGRASIYTTTNTLTVSNTVGGSSAALDLETLVGFPSGMVRVGTAFHIRGTVGSTDVTAQVRVASGSAGAWVVETVAKEGTVGAFVTGAKVILSDVAEYGGSAPESEDFYPTQDSNVMQMFDLAFGKNMVALSQTTKFDNSLEYLGLEIQDRLFRMINNQLLFGVAAREPQSGKDYGVMKGLPAFMGLADTSAVTNGVVGKVDTGTTVDFWNLVDWLNARTMGSERLLCITSPSFATKIAKAAAAVNETARTVTVEFPRVSITKKEYSVGDHILSIVTDRNLESASPKFTDWTNTAAHQNMLFAIDTDNFKLSYHDNAELGLMTPSIRDIEQVRDKRVKERHMTAALSCAMWKLPSHGAYGITNT